MITAETAEDYCSQLTAVVLDFMFKYPDPRERSTLLRLRKLLIRVDSHLHRSRRIVDVLDSEEVEFLKIIVGEYQLTDIQSDNSDEHSLEESRSEAAPAEAADVRRIHNESDP